MAERLISMTRVINGIKFRKSAKIGCFMHVVAEAMLFGSQFILVGMNV